MLKNPQCVRNKTSLLKMRTFTRANGMNPVVGDEARRGYPFHLPYNEKLQRQVGRICVIYGRHGLAVIPFATDLSYGLRVPY